MTSKAIANGKPLWSNNGNWVGWNRDVAGDDLEFGGCLGKPFLNFAGHGWHCLSTDDDVKALEWGERIWGMKLGLPLFWGDGKTVNPTPCKNPACSGKNRFVFLFVSMDYASKHKTVLKEIPSATPTRKASTKSSWWRSFFRGGNGGRG